MSALRPGVVVIRLVLVSLGFAGMWRCGAGEAVQFNRDIRPILSEHCFQCHGPDKGQRKAELRLDVREAALERSAFVPGKPDESELIRRIVTADAEEVMPPPSTHKRLTVEQKERLRRWVADGAVYQPHWAYIRPERPPVPPVKNREWVRNPIDAFVLAGLEARGWQPAEGADSRVLLRRLSLDLTGLPPSREEVEAFAAEGGERAYRRQVERLMDSPHYGERMAVPWLDVVRYADTVGYHGDQNQNIFPYRDYVIEAFNRNKPFDRFTAEQLAGDLLPESSIEALIATGFNRLNMMTREGGAQPREYLAKYAADRVRTVSMAWLGSTMGCAECHDHKYDPFSTKDFYQLAAFFADVRQWGVYQDYGYTPNPDLKNWSNDHPFPPEIEVQSPHLQRRMRRLEAQRDERMRGGVAGVWFDPKGRAAFEAWHAAAHHLVAAQPDGWATLAPSVEVVYKEKGTNAPPGPGYEVLPDRTILFEGPSAERMRITLSPSPGWISAIRVELLPHERHGHRIVRNDAERTSVRLAAGVQSVDAAEVRPLPFWDAEADFKQDRYANGHAIIGVKDVWVTSARLRARPQSAVWLLEQPLRVAQDDRLVLTLTSHAPGRIRVSVTPLGAAHPLAAGADPEWATLLARDARRWSEEDRAQLIERFLWSTGWNEGLLAQGRRLQREIRECREGIVPTMVTQAAEPAVVRVLPRGNWQDESGEVVQPAAPHFLPPIANPENRRLTRLDLARWLTSRDNPLVARTTVNRLWKMFFGSGLSAVVDDLGAQGEPPTHPELLDWLAVEFMESGWDVKHLVRLMVSSSTYRQMAQARPEVREADPANRWLGGQSPRRLEAEFVRDNALAIAGLIHLEAGGPSFFPYQPAGYYVNLQFPDRDYVPERDERQYRRGVYAHWQRTFLQPMLANFDAPAREECTGYRIVSNTPQQALTLLNDPTFVEAARVFAARLLARSGMADDGRLSAAFEQAVARRPRPQELESLAAFLSVQRDHYRANLEEALELSRTGAAPIPSGVNLGELAAWTQVCRVILNLHETLTRY